MHSLYAFGEMTKEIHDYIKTLTCSCFLLLVTLSARPGSSLCVNHRVFDEKLRGYPQFEIDMSSRRFLSKHKRAELKKYTRKLSMSALFFTHS